MKAARSVSWLLGAVAAATLGAARVAAEVATDGSIGPMRSISGPAHLLPAELGQQRGGNLFHSLRTLNLAKGESLTFTGPQEITNILTRITGGPSSIDGTLASQIDGANLFLINRDGVLFGPNARLDISGSLVVTTADVVILQDGGKFAAVTQGESVLTSAAPAEFGFLGNNAASVRLKGTPSAPAKLTTPDGRGISILAGEVELSRAALRSPAGWVQVTSVGGSANQLTTDPRSPGLVTSSASPPTGTLLLRDRSRLDTTQVVDFSPGQSAPGSNGTVNLAAGDVALRRSNIEIINGVDTAPGKPVSIRASRGVMLDQSFVGNIASLVADSGMIEISVRDGALQVVNGSAVTAASLFQGNAGSVTVVADTILLDATTVDASDSSSTTGISSLSVVGPGSAGSVVIRCRRLDLVGGAQVAAATFGTGDAGTVEIVAADIYVDGGGGATPLGITSSSNSTGFDAQGNFIGAGDAGNVVLRVSGTLRVVRNGVVAASTVGPGNAGDVEIAADRIVLNGGDSLRQPFIAAGSVAENEFAGAAGDVTLTGRSLRIFNGGLVSSETQGFGSPGSVSVTMRDIHVDGQLTETVISKISSSSNGGVQPGGDVNVRARSLTITNGATVAASAQGDGDGGSVTVVADQLTVSGTPALEDVGGSVLGAVATGAGNGGTVTIDAASVTVRNGSVITTAAVRGAGDGGLLQILAGDVIIDGGETRKETGILAGILEGGTGSGGTIDIRATGDVTVRRGGLVVAGTEGTGPGGDVVMRSGQAIRINDAQISAASGDLDDDPDTVGTGPAGNLTLAAPYIRIEQGGEVTAFSQRSSGGSITFSGHRLDLLDSRLSVSADTRGGSVVMQFDRRIFVNNSQINALGNEEIGKIDIDPEFTILNNSSLLTDTRPGGGGNIEIVTDQLIQANSTITAAGEIRIDVLRADTDVTAGLLELRSEFLDESARLKDVCGKQTGEGVSSFIVEGRGGIPITPGAPLSLPGMELKK